MASITEFYATTSPVSIGQTQRSLADGSGSSYALIHDQPGIYQLYIDCTNMQAGDRFDINIYDGITSTIALDAIYTAVLDGAQSAPFISPALMLGNFWDMTITGTGTGIRSFVWSIRKVG